MRLLLFFLLGAIALRLLDTLWQMVVGTPVPELVECDGGMEERCPSCGGKVFTSLGDGTYICYFDGTPITERMEFVVTYEGGGESTTTPPWFYEIFWN